MFAKWWRCCCMSDECSTLLFSADSSEINEKRIHRRSLRCSLGNFFFTFCRQSSSTPSEITEQSWIGAIMRKNFIPFHCVVQRSGSINLRWVFVPTNWSLVHSIATRNRKEETQWPVLQTFFWASYLLSTHIRNAHHVIRKTKHSVSNLIKRSVTLPECRQ